MKSRWNCSYTSFAFAMAALPFKASSRCLPSASRAPAMRRSSTLSTAVSMRLTKTLATEATFLRSCPFAARSFRPSMYARAVASQSANEKSVVMLTFRPSAIRRRTALTPASVPGTLIMTLSRARSFQSRSASRTVPSVSWARAGGTSRLT